MSAAGVRAFFISVAAIAVLVLIAFLCGILPESPFLAFLKAEEMNEYLSANRCFYNDWVGLVAGYCSVDHGAVCNYWCEDSR